MQRTLLWTCLFAELFVGLVAIGCTQGSAPRSGIFTRASFAPCDKNLLPQLRWKGQGLGFLYAEKKEKFSLPEKHLEAKTDKQSEHSTASRKTLEILFLSPQFSEAVTGAFGGLEDTWEQVKKTAFDNAVAEQAIKKVQEALYQTRGSAIDGLRIAQKGIGDAKKIAGDAAGHVQEALKKVTLRVPLCCCLSACVSVQCLCVRSMSCLSAAS